MFGVIQDRPRIGRKAQWLYLLYIARFRIGRGEKNLKQRRLGANSDPDLAENK